MDITGIVTLAGAVALVATISILTIGSFTLITAISTKAFEKSELVNVIGESENGSPETRRTVSYTFKGRNADRLRDWILAFPARVLFGYVLTGISLSIVPMLVFNYDAQVVKNGGRITLEFGSKLPEWANSIQSANFTGFVLAWLTSYCVALVIYAGRIKHAYVVSLGDQELLTGMHS